MAKRIKWTANGISFRRGNYQDLIARLDNCSKWVAVGAICSTQTFKADIRAFAQKYDASEIEIRPYYDDDGKPTIGRRDVVAIRRLDAERFYIFYYDGEKNVEVTPEEIFNS